MADDKIPRRDFLKGAGAGTAAAALATGGARVPAALAAEPAKAAPAAEPEPQVWLTLSPSEVPFLTAAMDMLIPADELSPSGSDCGLVVFIDRQLAGAYGNGARFYRDGPFLPGKPELGYQLALTPREFFRAGISMANDWCRETYGKELDRLSEDQRLEALKTMEAGKADFTGFTSAFFFDALLGIAMEGFFADPMYGGNRDKVAWKMIGFPGLPASYREEIHTYFNKKYDKEPQSIADFS